MSELVDAFDVICCFLILLFLVEESGVSVSWHKRLWALLVVHRGLVVGV